ncbi:MAG: PEP/pyruvate-binding domain-containing protein [Patescibacteria group bacterium]
MFLNQHKNINVSMAGGKGASLSQMTRVEIPVPSGFVVLTEAFNKFLIEENLREEIKKQLSMVDPECIESVTKASSTLRNIIHNKQVSKKLRDEIYGAYDKLDAKFVAVRSSATTEDSSTASWAGELETFLNVARSNVIDKLKECWSSLFTPRAILYRFEKGLTNDYVGVAVVVQEMVQAEISGVAFTTHPVTGDSDKILIEAGYGLGEAIVGGAIIPDNYIISKSNLAIKNVYVGEQTKKLVRDKRKQDKYGGNRWINLGAKGLEQKLSNRQIIEAAKLFNKIENLYNYPCDIEWAMENEKLYVTQSRPITTLKAR